MAVSLPDFGPLDAAVGRFADAVVGLFDTWDGQGVDPPAWPDAVCDAVQDLLRAGLALKKALGEAPPLPWRKLGDDVGDPPSPVIYPPDTLPELADRAIKFCRKWLKTIRRPGFFVRGRRACGHGLIKAMEELRAKLYAPLREAVEEYDPLKKQAEDAALLFQAQAAASGEGAVAGDRYEAAVYVPREQVEETVTLAVKAALAAAAEIQGAAEKKPERPKRTRKKKNWLQFAKMLIRKNPDASDSDVARQVGVFPSTLSRSQAYQDYKLRCQRKAKRGTPPRGVIHRDKSGRLTVDGRDDRRPEDDLDV